MAVEEVVVLGNISLEEVEEEDIDLDLLGDDMLAHVGRMASDKA